MGVFLSEVSSWVTASLLGGAMLVGWAAGWWRGRQLKQAGRGAPAGKWTEAMLALLGLLLAFVLSLSLGKHNQRRQMVVVDSNAIGDFYTCASLLDDPLRGQLQGVIHRYTKLAMQARGDLRGSEAATGHRSARWNGRSGPGKRRARHPDTKHADR